MSRSKPSLGLTRIAHRCQTAGTMALLLVPLLLMPALTRSEPATRLTAYWPLDELTAAEARDSIGSSPLELRNLSHADLTTGRRGQALRLDGETTLLSRRYEGSGPLPIHNPTAYTISLWVKGRGQGQADRRLFSEASTETDTPLFNIGTAVDGNSGRIDLYIRSNDGTTLLGHRQSKREPLDGRWHHLAWVDVGGHATLYIDGVADEADFHYESEGLDLNTTSIGGIRRAEACCFFKGTIDDVALWRSALTPSQIAALADGVPPPEIPATAPVIVGEPAKRSLKAGSAEATNFSLTAPVAGTAPFRIQWLKDGEPLPEATDRTLSFEELNPDDSGNYAVRVENEIGATEAPIAQLEISKPYYRIEKISPPAPVELEVGGMDFMEDGRFMVATRRGEVWSYHQEDWTRFAVGLDEPMGLCATGPDELVVAQRPELTRITDTDGDGVGDLYETLTDAWNYSGHMYEWAFGPVQDDAGNLWGALAYWFFPSERYHKPPYADGDLPDLLRLGYIHPPSEYSPDPHTAYRGWSFKVTPDGEFVPWSTGLRSPNGIGISPEGEIFVSDNQGEYLGTSPLHHITRDAFHGYPIGLLWDDRVPGDPTTLPMEKLQALKKPPALLFPYGDMGQSISQPVWNTSDEAFGPFDGQLFIGDQTKAMVMRASLEKVQGEYQGACFPFLEGFRSGVNRLRFSPDGTLFVGQTDRGWGSVGEEDAGLHEVVWSGETPMEIETMKLTPNGFKLRFTQPVALETARAPDAYSIRHYRYHYHPSYGSPRMDEDSTKVKSVRVGDDARTVSLTLHELIPEKIYEIELNGITAADGTALRHHHAYYTLNRLKR